MTFSGRQQSGRTVLFVKNPRRKLIAEASLWDVRVGEFVDVIVGKSLVPADPTETTDQTIRRVSLLHVVSEVRNWNKETGSKLVRLRPATEDEKTVDEVMES